MKIYINLRTKKTPSHTQAAYGIESVRMWQFMLMTKKF